MDERHLERHPSNAVLIKDDTSLEKYKLMKKRLSSKDKIINDLTRRLEKMEKILGI